MTRAATPTLTRIPTRTLTRTLTTPEFHAAVYALAPRIAVFDCDGTLWSGDAGSTFMRWTMGQLGGELDPPALLESGVIDWLSGRYEQYLRGEVSELVICGEMVQCFRALHVDVLREAAARFFAEHIEHRIFPEMRELIAGLQATGCDIWAVSSTCDWVIEEGVKRFNIPADRVLAAKVECVSGVATNRLLDVPTDEGKVASLARVGITAPEVVFGNSVHDAAMLAIARGRDGASGAFAVNPSPALAVRAAEEGWPLYWPASVAP